MKKLFFAFFLLVLSPRIVEAGPSACAGWLLDRAFDVEPARIFWDSKYQMAKRSWEEVLQQGQISVGGYFQEFDRSAPETWMALADVLAGPSAPFRNLIERLENKEIRLLFKARRVRSSQMTAKTELRNLWPLWKPAFVRMVARPRLDSITIYYPDLSNADPKTIFAFLQGFATVIFRATPPREIARSPFGSATWNSGDKDFASRLAAAMANNDLPIYQAAAAWQKAFGDDAVTFPPPEAKAWRWGNTSVVLRVLLNLLNPVASIRVKGNRADSSSYGAYKDALNAGEDPQRALQAELRARFRDCATAKYFADRKQDLWNVCFLGLVAFGTVVAAKDCIDGTVYARFLLQRAMLDTFTNPREAEAADEEYRADTEGNAVVNAFYKEQIHQIQEDIRLHGDPDGKKAADIKAAEDLRDYQRN